MIINLTRILENLPSFRFDTYITWSAWKVYTQTLGLSTMLFENEVEKLIYRFEEVQSQLQPTPIVPFQIVEGEQQINLKAVYGSNGDCTCIVIMTDIEEPWLKPLFPLGEIVITPDAKDRLRIGFQNAALGRHVVGDENEASMITTVNQLLFQRSSSQEIASAYDMPSIGELAVVVTTNLETSVTTVCMPWEVINEEF